MLEGNEAEDQLRRDIKRLSDDLMRIKNTIGGRQQEYLHKIKDEAALRLEDAREMARQRVKQADAYVHDRPWSSLAVAAAVGALLGALFSRRR